MNRQQRSSKRSSHHSSGASSSVIDGGAPHVPARRRVKECCRKTVAFMCTQVGVGAMIVVYALVGAASFISIETNANFTSTNNGIDTVRYLRQNCTQLLWRQSVKYNVFNATAWHHDVNEILLAYQNNVTREIKLGYDGHTPKEKWSFPAALMFCLSVFSMIGYGNLTPRTQWGKGTTIIYATFGIPLYILYFMNIGKVLAKTFRVLYTWIHQCTGGGLADTDSGDFQYVDDGRAAVKKKIIVPSTACLWVMSFYILIGTLMFAHWENWDYLDAVYFCVTSLCKIGMGDFVPGTTSNQTISVLGLKIQGSSSENQTKLVINFVYMLLGMGLVAMCYNLMREDVRVKIKEMKEDMALCMEDLRLRFSKCCGGTNKDL